MEFHDTLERKPPTAKELELLVLLENEPWLPQVELLLNDVLEVLLDEKLPPKALNDELVLDEKLAPARIAGRTRFIGGGGTNVPIAPPIAFIAPPIAPPIAPNNPPNGGRGIIGMGRGIGRKFCAKFEAAWARPLAA